MLPWRRFNSARRRFLSGLLLTALAGCAGLGGRDRIDPPAPRMKAPPPPQAPASSFHIPITLNLAPAFRKMEELLPDSLERPAYEEDFGTGGPDRPACGVGCGYRLARGPLSIRGEGDALKVSGILGYGFRCRKRIPCWGPGFSAGCGMQDEPLRQARLQLSGTVALEKDWSVSVRTRLDSLIPESPCEIAFLKVDITGFLLKAAARIYRERASRADSLIAAKIDLRSRVDSLWQRLSEPARLAENLYLDIRPRSVSAAPIRLSDSTLRTTLGLVAYPAILATEKPAAMAVPLPEASQPAGAEGFRLFLPVRLDYSEVNRRLRQRFKLDSGGLRFPKKGFFHLRIDRVELAGFGDSLLIKAHFRGFPSGGTVYLVGVPRFDTSSRVLSVDHLAYSLETRRIMVKTLNWLSHERFLDQMQDLLTVPLGPRLDALRKRLDRALNQTRGRLRLSGEVGTFALRSVESEAETQALVVRLEGSGRLSLHLD